MRGAKHVGRPHLKIQILTFEWPQYYDSDFWANWKSLSHVATPMAPNAGHRAPPLNIGDARPIQRCHGAPPLTISNSAWQNANHQCRTATERRRWFQISASRHLTKSLELPGLYSDATDWRRRQEGLVMSKRSAGHGGLISAWYEELLETLYLRLKFSLLNFVPRKFLSCLE